MDIKIGIPIVIERVMAKGPKASRELDMLLDTGARFCSLSWEVLQDLGYDPAGIPDRITLVTANGVIEVPKLRIEKMAVGDLSVDGIEVVYHSIPETVGLTG